MSVQNSAVPEVTSYDDLRRDFMKVEVTAEAAEHNSTDGSVFWSPGAEYEVISTRDMASELVAVDVLRLKARARETDNVGTTPGHVDARLEISTSASMENLPGVTAGELMPATGQGTGFDQDTATGPSMIVEQFDDTEVLFSFFKSGLTPFNDTVNGTGGGGSYQDYLMRYNFQELAGRGPVFDRQDELWFHALLQGIQSPNQWWNLGAEFIFYWNDFEIESRF